MNSSVWPYDHAGEAFGAGEEYFRKLRCFVLCPTEPRQLFDELFGLIRNICRELGQRLGEPIDCCRAIDITSSGIIHPEIWRGIRNADIVLADISGLNGNVLLELGVAAAWHKKQRVIILRENNPHEARLFDILPARHIEYARTPSGFSKLTDDLFQTLQDLVASAPFVGEYADPISLPLALKLTDGSDPSALWTPGMGHRRSLGRCLEFGSVSNFRFGWLTVGDLRVRNVRVEADLAPSYLKTGKDDPDIPWFGVMLRSQGYLANYGHLAYVRSNGTVWITLEEDRGTRHTDIQIGTIDNWDLGKFVHFDIAIDHREWRIKIGTVEHVRSVKELPYVFGEGRVLFEGYSCWIGLKNLRVTELASPAPERLPDLLLRR